jgi:hypothetical protein
MTALDIALVVMYDRWRRHFCVPCYTPVGWWEMDVCELTEAGFIHEYEIKLSRQDFMIDAKKIRKSYNRATRRYDIVKSKHQLLAAGDPVGPSTFTFVTAKDIVKIEDIPQWAGWIEHHDRRLVRRKESPTLHRQKSDDKIRQHMRSVCYYRFHTAISQYARLTVKGRKKPPLVKPLHQLPPVRVPGLIDISAPEGQLK